MGFFALEGGGYQIVPVSHFPRTFGQDIGAVNYADDLAQ
jgi:hypothetical protein